MSSGWFDYTEPHLHKGIKVCSVPMHLFHSEPSQTFTNHFNTEKARCVEVYHMHSRWFDYTEPSRTTSSQVDQGVYGTYTLVLGGYTPCYLCTEVVREGSRRFTVVEPPGTSV